MQMIEVRVSYEDGIKWRKILYPQTGAAQALENEEPRREDGIDYYVASANLKKEGGMTNESDTHLPVNGEHRAMGSPRTSRHSRVSHQPAELTGFPSDTDIQHLIPWTRS